MLACHRCHHKPCCRPTHLYEGTKSDNELDKGAVRGESWLDGMRAPRGDTIIGLDAALEAGL
jgi:hypothetical protein